MHIRNGGLYSVGEIGVAWSRSAAGYTNSATAVAHSFSFTKTGVNPSTGPYDRWYGRSLRCLESRNLVDLIYDSTISHR